MNVEVNPYLTGTSFDEIYRGQYHYSPPTGWMNDINGLWYYNGVYHLTFQSNPHDLTVILTIKAGFYRMLQEAI